MSRRGVSIVELVVVLAIIAVIMGMFIPAIQRAREAAQRTVCLNNIRQVNLALIHYCELSPLAPTNPPNRVGGWTIDILPFLERPDLEEALPVGEPLDQVEDIFYKQPRFLRCPTQYSQRPKTDSIASAHYVLQIFPEYDLTKRRERASFTVLEVPLTYSKPWVTSPELWTAGGDLPQAFAEGVHDGGYHASYSGTARLRF